MVVKENVSFNIAETFVFFEKQQSEDYFKAMQVDRDHETDHNGNYIGSYVPEKTYVVKMLAFLDEYNLANNVVDISHLNGSVFFLEFELFKNKMLYLSTRYSLRKGKNEDNLIGTPITFSPTYKSKIGSLLDTIRKIVNQEITDENKRDKIFSKIANLQLEIDKDRTTIDAVFSRAIDLTKVVGECTENLEPFIEKMERIKKIFWDNSDKLNHLENPDRLKRIEHIETSSEGIPF